MTTDLPFYGVSDLAQVIGMLLCTLFFQKKLFSEKKPFYYVDTGARNHDGLLIDTDEILGFLL